jgi:16S rRNA (cytidine1402-2'-O)-methyltransferase
LVADLRDLAATMPDRACVVGRELTKFHEELWRGLLADAEAHWAQHKVRGEVTLVVFGGPPAQPDAGEAVRLARDAIAAGERPSSAVRRIAEETGVSRRVLYGVVIEDDSLPEIDD